MSETGHFLYGTGHIMRKKDANILVVDDDEDILFSAKVWLRKFFTEVIGLNSPKQILSAISEKFFDVVLLDMNFRRGFEDGKEGLYWLDEIREASSDTAVILMTAYGEVELAVEGLKKGASDFILKPWDNQKLYAAVNVAVDLSRKSRKLRQWSDLGTGKSDYLLETKSPKMQEIFKTLEKVAPTDANVLLLGENGTGKFVLAEFVHLHSSRRSEPFVHIDLGSLSENLFEAELFGYAKGAFTDARTDKAGKIENANGGTVFLDEIGNLPLHIQQKLLTVIQTKKLSRVGETRERQLDIRFIVATNSDLRARVREGKFRQDLYYRINTVEVYLPPLRERTEDMPALCDFFIKKYGRKYGKNVEEVRNYDEILGYSFPGNIRELEHAIEKAVILTETELISIPVSESLSLGPSSETLNIEEMEVKLIKEALRKFSGNVSMAAGALGLTRASLYRRMEKFGL